MQTNLFIYHAPQKAGYHICNGIYNRLFCKKEG
nr:MAG TPA: Initiation control protein YabA [Caudoviricetes sp.]